MSHTQQHVCPNCNYETNENYCAHCGQEVHLHDDSLRALILHFIGHYFHYESKLWQTLKTLFTKPGTLTLAYWQKQRMRYLSPISFYIFVSATFFLTSALFPEKPAKNASHAHAVEVTVDAQNPTINKSPTILSKIGERATDKGRLLLSGNSESLKLEEKFTHATPKVFFFLIPFLALLLRLFFIRRNDVMIVHHTIFSLHIHTFVFSIMTVLILMPFDVLVLPLAIAIAAASLTYFAAALKRVYAIGWGRAAAYAVSVSTIYMASLFLLVAVLLIYIL